MKQDIKKKTFENILPQFSTMTPARLLMDFYELLKVGRAQVEKIIKNPPKRGYTWESFVLPLDLHREKVAQAMVIIDHLNMVLGTDELTKIEELCSKNYIAYMTELAQSKKLYDVYQCIADGSEYDDLSPAQKKVLDNTLRDFKLAGVDLPDAQKARFGKVQEELSVLSSQFRKNVQSVTDTWNKHITDKSMLAGIPKHVLDGAVEKAQESDKLGWLLGIDPPTYVGVMTYADNEALREEVYEAFVTRASDVGPHDKQYDNTDIMESILALRHESAQILGFNNYAERSLSTKMAQTTDEVMSMLEDSIIAAREKGLAEFDELCAFAKEHHEKDTLQPWNIAYYAEKLKQHKYNVSAEKIREYFLLGRVMSGAFEVAHRLYGIDINEVIGVDAWHKDVRLFEVRGSEGNLLGRFYTDLHARPHKKGGAWVDGFMYRRKAENGIQVPLGVLCCNFSPLVGGRITLTFEEVKTFFHEFGHTLHNMLTTVDEPSISGFEGVEWDVVELPSQFMENYCWEEEAIGFISGKQGTGEALPADMFANMYAVKNFQYGMFIMRQTVFALFDFRLHLEYDPAQGGRVQTTWDTLMEYVAVTPSAEYARMGHSFSHIFCGGYSAGYYSYQWAEILSADAFSKFEENGIFDRKTGEEFLQSILSRGGERPAMENFVEFRGRKPSIDPLRRQRGLNTE